MMSLIVNFAEYDIKPASLATSIEGLRESFTRQAGFYRNLMKVALARVAKELFPLQARDLIGTEEILYILSVMSEAARKTWNDPEYEKKFFRLMYGEMIYIPKPKGHSSQPPLQQERPVPPPAQPYQPPAPPLTIGGAGIPGLYTAPLPMPATMMSPAKPTQSQIPEITRAMLEHMESKAQNTNHLASVRRALELFDEIQKDRSGPALVGRDAAEAMETEEAFGKLMLILWPWYDQESLTRYANRGGSQQLLE